MRVTSLSVFAACLLVFLEASGRVWAEGAASVDVAPDMLGMELGFESGEAVRTGLALEAKAGSESARLRYFLELGLDEEGKAGLSIGPASPEGCLRFIHDPVSSAKLDAAVPVKIDASLKSSREAFSVGSKDLSAFAIASGPDAAALGMAVRGSAPGCTWAALVDASIRSPDPGSSGWKLENPPDEGGTVAHAALLARRVDGAASASAAIGLSAGSRDALSLAAKLGSEGRIGPVSLNVSMCAADAGYRGLFGDFEDRLGLLEFGARIALRRSSSLAFSRKLWADRAGRLAFPEWRASSAASLSMSLGERRELRLSAAIDGEDRLGAELRLLRSGFMLSVSASEDELELGMELSRSLGCGAPNLDLRWKIRSALAEDRGFPLATGRLDLSLPIASGREISACLSLPDKGVSLGPLSASGEALGLEISIGYRVSISAR